MSTIHSNDMHEFTSDRSFQLWEFKVSHGSLLIRSPKAPGIERNLDFVCLGVEYLAAPRHLQGIKIEEPTKEELQMLSGLLSKKLLASQVRIIVSENRRFPIVAAGFQIAESDGDIFDSPFA